MTTPATARLLALCALLTAACGDAVSTTPAGDAGTAQDGAAGAGAAWCGRHPETASLTPSCPAVWPPAGATTSAPSIACHASDAVGQMDTLESCVITISFTPAQRAFLATCDMRAFPVQPCAPQLAPDGGACVMHIVSAGYARAVALEVVRTGRCW